MYRSLSLVVLVVAVFASTPVDAQIFRRFAAPAPAYGQWSQQQACQQQQYQLQQQQLLARQQQLDSVESDPLSARQETEARSQSGASAQSPTAPQPQRYAVYYNPRTNQRFLRPIPSTADASSATNRRTSLFQRSNAQVQRPVTPANPVENPVVNQADIARQAPVATKPEIVNLSLNAPATSSPTGTLTNLPPTQPAAETAPPAPVAPTKADASEKTFSILESDK